MIPKRGGHDCELSTTGVDADGNALDGYTVARAVLRHIPEASATRGGRVWTSGGTHASCSTDYMRRWGSNGGCHYGDLGHVECCTPTCLDPFEFARRALLSVLIAEQARRLAEDAAHGGARYLLSTANTDLRDPSISFGSHLSMTIEKPLWSDLFEDPLKPSRLPMVASAMAAAIPFFGAGYILPMRDGVYYSLSARAHHLTRVWTFATTQAFRRGILNSRREPHGDGFERLHLIAFDFCLLSGSLLFSFLQCLLAAAEESVCHLQLLDPVRALRTWSWGIDLNTGRMPAHATLVGGRQFTLPEYLREVTEVLLRMSESGLIPETVAPHARVLLPKIIQLTEDAQSGNVAACARHLTWASKLLCLLKHCQENDCTLGDASTRLLDHDYANTDPERGVFWKLWENGDVDPLVSLADVEAGWAEAPRDTRDYVRGRLIEKYGSHICDIDWSYVEFRLCDHGWGHRVRVDLPHLEGLNHTDLDSLIATSRSVDELVERLRADHAARSVDPVNDATPHLWLPENHTGPFRSPQDN